MFCLKMIEQRIYIKLCVKSGGIKCSEAVKIVEEGFCQGYYVDPRVSKR